MLCYIYPMKYVTSIFVAWIILASVGILAILMGLFAPPHPLTVPGWAFLILPVLMPVWGVVRGRQRERLMRKSQETRAKQHPAERPAVTTIEATSAMR
jgi:hypothetical protein